MKANLYDVGSEAEVKAIEAAIDTSGSDEEKAKLSTAELKALDSLTGFECARRQVKFGKLKTDLVLSGGIHKEGDGAIIAEAGSGRRFAIFAAGEVVADEAKAAAIAAGGSFSDTPLPAGESPEVAAGGVIVPPAPPDMSAEHG